MGGAEAYRVNGLAGVGEAGDLYPGGTYFDPLGNVFIFVTLFQLWIQTELSRCPFQVLLMILMCLLNSR